MNSPDRGKPSTIKDVAREAGVSFKTVSRVVNREPAVRADTREAVLRAMERLGYAPNVSARQLASQRSFLIVLLIWYAPSDYSAALQAGAERRCRELGYHLIVETVSPGEEPLIVERLRALRVDGVIVTAPQPQDGRLVKDLEAAGIRLVLVSPAKLDTSVLSVGMDDEEAGFQMTRHLIELGHRDIAFLSGADLPAGALRRAGFLRALASAGLPYRPEYDAQCERSFRANVDRADELLDLAQPPTAVFAWNDLMALAVLMAGARRGLHIPAQLSVAGFDDSPMASFVWPRLTTIRQPLQEMATAAVDLLVERAPRAATQISFPFELIVRDSTAPPAA